MLDTLPDGLTDQVPELAAEPDGVRDVETDSSDFLVRSTSVDATDGTWHVITASTSDDEVLNEVAVLLIVSIAVINIGFGVASWWIGSAALRPVTRLRRSAEELVSAPSAELLPVGPAQDEIADLATTLNELIGGLRASAERERQIVSDASHEFRTPLAIIQTRLELAQREAGDPGRDEGGRHRRAAHADATLLTGDLHARALTHRCTGAAGARDHRSTRRRTGRRS